MDKKLIIATLQEVKKNSPKRKFTQRVEAIINLKELNLKKTEEQVDTYIELPKDIGKVTKVCGFVGAELSDTAKKNLDFTITQDQFDKYDPAKIKKLANEYRYFIAQANIMPAVAKTFGRILGQKGKLPSPKAGCVVAPGVDLIATKDKLSRTVRAVAKTQTCIKVPVGNETMTDEDLAENIMQFYNKVKAVLPQEEGNIKNLLIKFTMGPAVAVTSK